MVRAALTTCVIGIVSVGVLLLVVEAGWAPLRVVDEVALGGLHAYATGHHWFVVLMAAVSTVGSWWVYLVVVLGLATWLGIRRRIRMALFVAVTVEVSPLLNQVMKTIVHRPRPVWADPVASASGASFPSGHAQAAVVGYGVLVLVLLPSLRRAFRVMVVSAGVLMVLAIGFSRVALGVHYVSDVVAGWALGVAWVASMIVVVDPWRGERAVPQQT